MVIAPGLKIRKSRIETDAPPENGPMVTLSLARSVEMTAIFPW